MIIIKKFKDIIIIIIMTILAFFIASYFKIFDILADWSNQIGESNADEIFSVLIFLSFAFLILTIIKSKKLKDEIKIRQCAEEKIKNYVTRLEEAHKLKELFIDIIHHDLINPITVIKTVTELGMEKTIDNEMRNSLVMIKRNTDKLLEIFNCAILYSKLENSEKLDKTLYNLNDILKKVIDNFKMEFEKKNMKLIYQVNSECYATVNQMIENVFSNLISNAIKYSPEGSKIEVNISDEKEYCKIFVKDWGYGISDEDKPKLFSRFQRVDKKGVKGSGLGLAIVKRIVELHNGKVWIENNIDRGSIFIVEIPKLI